MQGLITEKSFAEVLGEIFQRKGTGFLFLSWEELWKIIYIEEGIIKNTVSNQEEENIGEYLMSLDIISKEHLEQIQATQKEGNVYEQILALNLINEEDLLSYKEMLCKGIIFSLFNWLSGKFNYEERKLEGDRKYFVNFPIAEILLEGVKRINEYQFIQLRLGSLEQIPVLSESFYSRAKGLPLNPSETFVISRIDNKTTIKQIIEMTMLEEEEVCRCIYALKCMGFLTLEAPIQDEQQIYEKVSRTYEEYRFMEAVKNLAKNLDNMKDHEILGIDSVFDIETLRNSFEEAALKYNPERYSSVRFAGVKKELNLIYKRIIQAYINLSASTIDKPSETKYPSIAEKEKIYLIGEEIVLDKEALILFEKAKEFAEKGDYYQAVNLCQQAIEKNKKVPEFHLFIADIYSELPRFANKAIEHYLSYLEILPNNITVKLKLAELYIKISQWEKANKELQEIVELEPDNETAHQLISEIRDKGKQLG